VKVPEQTRRALQRFAAALMPNNGPFCEDFAWPLHYKISSLASLRAHFDPTVEPCERVVGSGGDRFNLRKVSERAGEARDRFLWLLRFARVAEDREISSSFDEPP
jgi:hypothetical protein